MHGLIAEFSIDLAKRFRLGQRELSFRTEVFNAARANRQIQLALRLTF